MRSVLLNAGTAKGIATDLKLAALVGLALVLPFVVLESLNNTLTRQNAQGLIALFAILLLLPMAFVAILVPMVRGMRAGDSVTAGPIALLLRVAALALIATAWGALVIDQLPCFMGLPNCD